MFGLKLWLPHFEKCFEAGGILEWEGEVREDEFNYY